MSHRGFPAAIVLAVVMPVVIAVVMAVVVAVVCASAPEREVCTSAPGANPGVYCVMALVVAGLRGGGWAGTAADLLKADIEGGAVGAAKAAALLLVRAFTPPK